jgi:hypothetical protein
MPNCLRCERERFYHEMELDWHGAWVCNKNDAEACRDLEDRARRRQRKLVAQDIRAMRMPRDITLR